MEDEQQHSSTSCASVFATCKKHVTNTENLRHLLLHSGLLFRHRRDNFTNKALQLLHLYKFDGMAEPACSRVGPLSLLPAHPQPSLMPLPFPQPVQEIWHGHLHSNKVRANHNWWIIVSGSEADLNFSSIKDSSSSVKDAKGSLSSHSCHTQLHCMQAEWL